VPEVSVSSPVVTFVVPAYKLAHLLPDCLESIRAQTFADFEVLVMDDCSPDDPRAVVEAIGDARMTHIRNEPNLGHLRNYNKGIGLARGKYVWLISADDRLRRPDALARMVAALDANPNAGYVYCPAMRLEGDVETRIAAAAWHGARDTVFRGHALLDDLLECNFIASPAALVRREYYDRHGAFPLDLPHAGDWYLWCLFALYGDVAYIADPLVHYRVHPASMCVQLTAHQTQVVVTDEIEVRWRIRQLARVAGFEAVARRATWHIICDYAARLDAGVAAGPQTSLTAAEVRESLLQHTDAASARRLLARVYATAGDRQYWSADLRRARSSYASALRANPWMLPVAAKYSLLRLGRRGAALRAVPARLRTRSSAGA